MVNGSLRLFNHWNWKSCRISNPLLSESVHSSHHSRHKLTFFSHCCSRLCVLYPKFLHESCPWSYYSLPVNLFYLSSVVQSYLALLLVSVPAAPLMLTVPIIALQYTNWLGQHHYPPCIFTFFQKLKTESIHNYR